MKNKIVMSLIAFMVVIFGGSMLQSVNVYAYGSSSLTSQEISLYSAHPVYAAKVKSCATKATESSQKLYKDYTLWQGNGDAYRHAYWSALMTKRTTENFAWKAGLAHEGLEPGYDFNKQDGDTKMDINNNYSGRKLAQDNSSKSESELSDLIKKQCSNGKLKRVRTYTSKKSKCDDILDGKMTHYTG